MRSFSDKPTFADSPTGIVTASGTRFRTTEKLLREFAGPVFERESLEALIQRAEAWAQSPVTIALWALPALLMVVPVWIAAIATLILFALWRLFSPSAPAQSGIVLSHVLQKPVLQGLYYVIVLTLLGWDGQTPAVICGLAGFISLRFGLIDLLFKPILAPALTKLYQLPIPDQVLRALIVRAALRHNVDLPEISQLEQSAREAWNIRGLR